MNTPAIIGLLLVKNEDLYVQQAIRNIESFCDHLIILDNGSTDNTIPILEAAAKANPRIELKNIRHLAESHKFIMCYAGTPTWIFAVDGDEVYDPQGLRQMRQKIQQGELDSYFNIYGNVLNCDRLDLHSHTAWGYLSPPARSMTKLYNFSVVQSWTGCSQRLHGGQLVFKDSYDDRQRTCAMHLTTPWEKSCFRCLHMCLTRRSSRQLVDGPRFSPSDVLRRQTSSQQLTGRVHFFTQSLLAYLLKKTGKDQGYRRGPKIAKDITPFFPPNEN
ncbi:MAG: glycosyltransferase [bacterium]